VGTDTECYSEGQRKLQYHSISLLLIVYLQNVTASQ